MHFGECLTESHTEYQKRRLLVYLHVTLLNQSPATYLQIPETRNIGLFF